MKTRVVLLLIACLSVLIIAHPGFSQQGTYYARCNLKVVKGSYISWVNWQSTQSFLPAGTRFNVMRGGSKATLTDIDTGSSYELDIGDNGPMYLEKFVTKEQVDISSFPESARQNIKRAVAKIGMTKEQVYIAMGPPAWAGKKTNSLTYEEIMRENLWTYKRKRFGKNIGVSFDPASGRVDRTEGIWGK